MREKSSTLHWYGPDEIRVKGEPDLGASLEAGGILVPASGIGRVDHRTVMVRTIGGPAVEEAEVPNQAGPDRDRGSSRQSILRAILPAMAARPQRRRSVDVVHVDQGQGE